MCYFEQTQFLACGHNVEMVIEKCELGERYRTSMHDKIITAIHTDEGKCDVCSPPPEYVEGAASSFTTHNTNGPTSDLPEPQPINGQVAHSDLSDSTPPEHPDLIDLTKDETTSKKRPAPDRRDSLATDDTTHGRLFELPSRSREVGGPGPSGTM
ncbi:uncharacterized protein PV09_07443 [Verruconis gallopava]|uniref:Uncharacterized protein n=1 Tax=Verruconis gallopava TaxID=253628 RepID=A0A0D1YJW7_9PEZI|nr:uncharacterized protein PV09_07443 [Verruconis gallopava]KIW01157.1 hypothetical protein PV09_07443 [Verruconis gallopava]